MERKDLNLYEWLNHLQEELMDASVYIEKVLEEIKNSENDGGIEIDKIIMNLREISPGIINQEIQKLLEVFDKRLSKKPFSPHLHFKMVSLIQTII